MTGIKMLYQLASHFVKQTCPYCFEQFRLGEAPFRCGNISCPGRKPDPQLQKHWPMMAAGKQGKILNAGSKVARRTTCDECHRPTSDRLCPTCHVTLPSTFGQCPNAIIAVIGAKNAGKGHYIGTLVEELRNNVGPSLDMTLSPQDDYTIKRFKEDFRDPLYNKRQVLDVTATGLTNEKVRLPMVFNLQLGGTDVFGRRKIKRTITLVFFDTAGEDLNSEATMETVNRYIYRSKGIVLLVDPRQIPRVRRQLQNPPDPREEMFDTRDIVSRTAKLIRKGRQLGPNTMIKTPLAIAISKFDELEPIVDPGLAVLTARAGGRRYDASEADAINDEIESLLGSWQEGGLVHDVRSSFRDVSFFGITSLGCQAKADKTLPRLSPRRVENPFLWLVHKIGYLNASK